ADVHEPRRPGLLLQEGTELGAQVTAAAVRRVGGLPGGGALADRVERVIGVLRPLLRRQDTLDLRVDGVELFHHPLPGAVFLGGHLAVLFSRVLDDLPGVVPDVQPAVTQALRNLAHGGFLPCWWWVFAVRWVDPC